MRAFTSEWRIVQRFRIKYVTGLVNLVVLASLKNKKMSGYDMLGLVHRTFDLPLSPGTLYPVLKSMEKEGLIMGVMNGRKRLYELTTKGESLYKSLSQEYERIISKTSFLRNYSNSHR
jgi:DNA-binding PadR family transcriptional regulator